MTQAFLPLLRQARGRIVNIGSIAGRITTPLMSPYCASKHAVEAVTDALRLELQPWGIAVSVIEPGVVATPIWEKGTAQLQDRLATMPAAALELYAPLIAAIRNVVKNAPRRAVPTEAVVRAVRHALDSARPRTRYVVGRDAKIRLLLQSVLPRRWMDGIVHRFSAPLGPAGGMTTRGVLLGGALLLLACSDALGPGEVAELALVPGTAWIGPGAVLDVTAQATDIEGEPVEDPSLTWTTSAPATATVSNGRVTGVAAGVATITASSGEVSASIRVTVVRAVPPSAAFAVESLGLTDVTLLGAWGDPSGAGFVAGQRGTLIRGEGDSWVATPTPTGADLVGIWGTSMSNVYAVGDSGVILHYDGSRVAQDGESDVAHPARGLGPRRDPHLRRGPRRGAPVRRRGMDADAAHRRA